MKEYDLIVIGSGPGGYVCAIRASQLGLKTAIVERYKTLGGTCLNVGCIPSKAWLDSSEKYFELVHHFQDHGIVAKDVTLDFPKMRERVKKVVSDVSSGVNFLMKKNKIDVYQGHGSFQGPHTVSIAPQNETISGKHIVIATGSKPSSLPGITIDKKRVITSTEALYLDELPKSMTVIGGGVIGIEMASVFRRLGTKVTVVEFADQILSTMDLELGKTLQKILVKEGIEFHMGHGVTETKVVKNKVHITAQNKANKELLKLESDYCLVAVGRKAYTQDLGLEKAGLKVDERGKIPTNSHLQTSVPHIYAIGDVTKGAMLAHKAEEEGVFVAEVINGEKPHIDYNLIPGVVYTWPEVSAVGASEQELKEKSIPYKVGSYPFKASGRARASEESQGFIKVLAHKETDEILGVHMIGPRVADLISEAVVAMEFRASAEDVGRICHPHPTYSEALKEACLMASANRGLNI